MEGTILDIHDDTFKTVYKQIANEIEVPQFVKTANFDLGEVGRETKKIFAYDYEKRFPLDTPEDVWMSHAYFHKTASKIPEFDRNYIEKEITKMASLMGLPLPELKQKPVEKKAGRTIELDKFAVCIPAQELDSEVRNKFANFIYQDHLVAYPLETNDDIYKANINFPQGLDGDLAFFRGAVATKIASVLPYDRLQQSVKDYLAIPKSKLASQLTLRAETSDPKYKEAYEELSELINERDFDLTKFASALEEIDGYSGFSKTNYLGDKPSYMSATDILSRGIIDDTVYTNDYDKVKVASSEYTVKDFKTSANELNKEFEGFYKLMDNTEKLASFIEDLSPQLQKYVANILNKNNLVGKY